MKTDFQAGGLTILDEPLLAAPRITAPDNFATLEWHDGRNYCLPTSNQGQTSACAGYTVAGYVEVTRWAETGIKEQVDGLAIYERAKDLEGNTSPGTTLSFAVKAAQAMGLIDKTKTIRTIKTFYDMKIAMHRHKCCITGAMINQNWNHAGDDGWLSTDRNEAIGGHAFLTCWFNEDKRYPLGVGWQNSWALKWGHQGFGRCSIDAFRQQLLYAVVVE